jgi:hypothetical protein
MLELAPLSHLKPRRLRTNDLLSRKFIVIPALRGVKFGTKFAVKGLGRICQKQTFLGYDSGSNPDGAHLRDADYSLKWIVSDRRKLAHAV